MGVTRRQLAMGVAATAVPTATPQAATSDLNWDALLRRLEEGQENYAATSVRLSAAEEKYYSARRKGSHENEKPDWFLAAEEADEMACDHLHSVAETIAETPARERDGLAAKVKLLAYYSNIDLKGPVEAEDNGTIDDLLNRMIRSLAADLF